MAPTTGHGIVYPDSTGNVQLWTHLQNLADSAETALDTYETFNSWTPAYASGSSGFTSVGSGGTNEGFYCQIGKQVHAEFRIQLGTSPTTTGTTFFMVLPVAPYVGWGGTQFSVAMGSWSIRDNSAAGFYVGTITLGDIASTSVTFTGAWTGTAPTSRVSNTVPMAWAIDDIFSGVLQYRAA